MAQRVEAVLSRIEAQDPGLRKFLKRAYGYAVFPSVGKASLVVGGAHGHGAVYERGKLIGFATMSQLTLGVQLGGDTFTEILAFHDKGMLDRFKKGQMAFTANASVALVKAAAASTSDFKGVTTHAYSSGGMLLELSLGGQKFNFKPLGAAKDKETGAAGGGKAKGPSRAAADEDEGDAEQDQGAQDETAEGGGLGEMIGGARGALGSVRNAASKVGDAAREHPFAATLIGAGVATGLAVMLVRAVHGVQGAFGSSDDSGDEQDEQDDYQSDQDDDEQDDIQDRGESDDYEDDERDESDGDEGQGEEEEEEHPVLRRGRARA